MGYSLPTGPLPAPIRTSGAQFVTVPKGPTADELERDAKMSAYAEIRAAAQLAYRDHQQNLRELNSVIVDTATRATAAARAALVAGDLDAAIEASMRAVAANNLVPLMAELQQAPPPRPDLAAAVARATS
jgi:hypothetical protein